MALRSVLFSALCLGLTVALVPACDSKPSPQQEATQTRTIAATCQPVYVLLSELLEPVRESHANIYWLLMTPNEARAMMDGEELDEFTIRRKQLLCPPGEDPTHWAPPRETLLAARQAELIFSIGDDFEPWVANANLAPSRHLQLLDGTTEALPEMATVTHRHGDGPAHSHAGRSPFVWMDPVRCAEITAWLNEEFSTRYADFGGLERSRQLAEAYRATDEQARGTFKRCKGIRLLGPSTGECAYWEQRYGVRIDPFDLPEGDGPLSTEELIAIRGRLDPTRPNFAFVRGDVSDAVRAQLAEKLELKVIALNNGLGQRDSRVPWANELGAHFHALDAALKALGR